MLRLATVFSGIGAVEHALKRMGIDYEIVFASDNGERKLKSSYENILNKIHKINNSEINKVIKQLYDKECKENLVEISYKANYEIKENNFFQDVRFIKGNEFRGKVDLFVGGSPCQSFSVMGKQRGLEEARGTLFYDYARLLVEIKPKVFIYENVYGMLTHDKGNTWKVISNIFNKTGYKWTYWTLNAKDYGLPQNRRRLFVIGYRDDFNNEFMKLLEPSKQILKKYMKQYLEETVDNKYYLPEKGFNRAINPNEKKHVALNGTIARCQVACQQYNWFGDMRLETEVPNRLMNDNRVYKGLYNGHLSVARCLTPRECLRLMGFDDSFKIVVPDQYMYRQVGNSIAVNVLMEILKSIFKTTVFTKGDNIDKQDIKSCNSL